MKHYFYMLFTLELYFQNRGMHFYFNVCNFCFIFVLYECRTGFDFFLWKKKKKSHLKMRGKKSLNNFRHVKWFIMNVNICLNKNCYAIIPTCEICALSRFLFCYDKIVKVRILRHWRKLILHAVNIYFTDFLF